MATAVLETLPGGERSSSPPNLQVCRLCLSEESVEDIFKQDDLHTLISDLLSIVVSQSDKISQKICGLCSMKLQEFREYQMRCLEVQDVLLSEIAVIEEKNHPQKEYQFENSTTDEIGPMPTVTAHNELQITAVTGQYYDNVPIENSNPVQDAWESVSISSDENEYYQDDGSAEAPDSCSTQETIENYPQPTNEAIQNKRARYSHAFRGNGEFPFFARIPKEVEGESEEQTELVDSPGTERGKTVFETCDMCGEKVKKFHLEGHLNSHLGVRPFKCKRGCLNVTFTSQYNRSNHYRHIHDAPQYVCSICMRQFGSRQGLFGHNQRFHIAKSHKCNVCDQAFVTGYRLKKHMMQHDSTKRKFSCSLCGVGYPTGYALTRHMKKHMPSDGDDYGRNWLEAKARQNEMDSTVEFSQATVHEAGEQNVEYIVTEVDIGSGSEDSVILS